MLGTEGSGESGGDVGGMGGKTDITRAFSTGTSNYQLGVTTGLGFCFRNYYY